MAKSPAVILFDSNGQAMAVEDGVAIPVGTQALLVAGSDGTDAHVLLLDSEGRPVLSGAGVAGTPAGGVVSIQGVVGGTALPISGTVTASSASTSSNNTAIPTSSTQIGGSDGTNLQAARVFDVDAGAGKEFTLGAVLRKSASGGSVEAGTSTDPLRVDPTGTTTQPISGSVSVSNFPATQPVSATSLPLPTGAATAAKQPGLGTAGSASSDVITVQGVTSMTPLKVDGSGATQPVSGSVSVTNFPATQPVSGTVTSNIGTTNGLALDATLTGGTQKAINRGGAKGTTVAADVTSTASGANHQSIDTVQYDASGNIMPAMDVASRAGFSKITDGTNTAAVKAASVAPVATDPALVVAISPNNTVPVSAVSLPLPTGAATAAKQPALGTAGTPSADVITVQGSTSMTALKVDGSGVTQPVSGSVTATISGTPNVAVTSSALPTGASTDATLTGGSAKAITRGGAKGTTTAADITSTAAGANHQALDVAIVDASGNQISSFGSDAQGAPNTTANAWPIKVTDGTSVGAVKAASTAAVATDPALVVAVSPNNTIKIDGSAVTQPVSGSVSVSNLPATQPVSGTIAVSNFPATQPVSAASLPLPAGASTAAKQPALGVAGTASSDVLTVQGISSMTALKVDGSAVTQPVSGSVSVGNFPATQPVSAASLPLPTGAATETTLASRLADATFTGRINTLGQKTSANSTPVVLASDQSAIPVTATGTATSTLSSVAGSASSVSILSSNASRMGFSLYNDSTQALYLKLNSGAASTTSFTVKIQPDGYYEGPFNYTGAITGIWVAANGSARITEFT